MSSAEPRGRLTEAQLRELVDALPHLVWTCLATGPCDYLSKQWVDYTGIPERDQLGYGWLAQLHPDDVERVKSEWAATVGKGVAFDIEFRIRRADGIHRWFRTRAIPLRDESGAIVKWFGSNADIDEYKVAQEASNRLVAILESSDDAIVGKTLDGVVTSWNRGAERLFGYSAREMIGAPIERIIPANRREEEAWILARVQHKEPIAPLETIRVRKDGSEVDVSIVVSPILDHAGNVIGASKIARDVSLRKRSEEALRRSEASLTATLESIGDAMIATDGSGRVVRMNPVATRLTGWPVADAIGRPLSEVFHIISEDTRAVVESPVERVLREGTVVGLANHTSLISKDGVERPIADSGAPIRDQDGKVTGVVLVFHDMTEERATERRLRQSEARFRRLYDSGIIGILVADLVGNIRHANDVFLSMVGYTREDLVAGAVRWSEMTPARWAARDAEAVAELRAGGACRPYEKEYLRKDGSIFPIFLGAAMIDDSDECICFVLDISERKHAERDLQLLNAELELRVEERTAQLHELNRELESFSYSVAHDLRAPLRGIAGFAQVLADDYAQALDTEGRECLAEIHSNASRMAQLIDALLSLSRVNRTDLHPANVDLAPLVRDVAAALQSSEPGRSVEWIVGDDLVVRLDPLLARTLIENLVGNAWKFTRDTASPKIEVGAIREKDAIVCFFRDNGAGFDMKYVDKLFSPFQRLHTSTEYPGTGIGLANIHRIVKRHGGSVWAEGAVGAGATFFIRLPTFESKSQPS